MTALPQPDAPGATVRCYATVEVLFTETDDGGSFRYSAAFKHDVDVDEDGTIHLRAALADGDLAEITFRLSSEDGAEMNFTGIQLGRSEDSLGPLTLETAGALYDPLPFKVDSNNGPGGPIDTLVLTEIGRQEEADSVFAYKLFVVHERTVYCDDPKIYNKGDGGGGCSGN